MEESRNHEVRFDVYCPKCKHYEHKYPNEDFSFEAQEPCNTCLETGMREGTRVPEYYEAK